MNKILVQALMDCLRFLELSGDDVLNPDVAIEVMEGVSWRLQQMDPAAMEQFAACLREIEADERQAGEPEERVSFLTTFMEDSGLVDEQDEDEPELG